MVSAIFLATVLAASGANDVTLLSFTADWCGVCQSVKPAVQRLTLAGFPVREVHIDRETDLVARFRVTSVPCFVLIQNGQEIERVSEATSYARLVQLFDRAGTPDLKSASIPGTPVVRGQSGGERNEGIGLPRPLANLARNMGPRQGINERKVAIESAPPMPSAIPAFDPSARPAGPAASAQPQRATLPPSTSAELSPGQDALHRQAIQATVRLRVDDLKGHSVGTGTIIDSYSNESLVVTCGHLFRDSSGRGRISVDLFAEPQPRTVTGTLISYDLEHDLALVAIPAPTRITAARVAPPGVSFERGQPVFSIGCDRGADPTVRATRITGIDRYVGTPNLEIAGEPVEGRSGGGLFSAAGELIGVCNAADPSDNEGIFASLPAIHWELDRIGQRRIYARAETELAQAAPQPRSPTPANVHPSAPATSLLSQVPPRPAVAIQSSAPTHHASDDTEVICIVRSRANPQGTEQLLILDRPSRDLLDRLSTESRGHSFPGLAQQTTPPPTSSLVPAGGIPTSVTATAVPAAAPQVIRAQSNEM